MAKTVLWELLRDRISDEWFFRIVNWDNFLGRRNYLVSGTPYNGIYLGTDSKDHIYICRRNYANRYKNGIMKYIDNLAHKYSLDKIDLEPGGVFVDCGANIGELGLWAAKRGLSYIAFEPELLESHCCDLNNFGGEDETRRVALWKKKTTLTFYSKPETSDSSVIDPGDAIPIKVHGITLSDAINLSDIPGTVILKVEAEGAEPEVLAGAVKVLPYVDYVAVDCSNERGVNRDYTFVETSKILYKEGFIPYSISTFGAGDVKALYRNERGPHIRR